MPMMGVAIGIGLVLLGLLLGNIYFVLCGFGAAFAFAIFNREPSVVYVKAPAAPTEAGPRHRVLDAEPPTDQWPMPGEMGIPMPDAMAQFAYRGARPPADPFVSYTKPLPGKWQDYGMTQRDLLPFGNYGHKSVAEWVLAGLPVNIGKIALSGKKRD
jgi:hypothetical protein